MTGTGSVFPRIDPEHPLARAARATNAYADDHGLEQTVEWLGMGDAGPLAYLGEQRALRAIAAATVGSNMGSVDDPVLGRPFDERVARAIIGTPLWRDMRALLIACYMDGFAIGWKGRELQDGGAEGGVEAVIASIRARLERAEAAGEPSEFRDGLAVAMDIAADAPRGETCPTCGLPDNCGDCNHAGTEHYVGAGVEVHVVAFRHKTPGEGVGGHEWDVSADAARARVAAALNGDASYETFETTYRTAFTAEQIAGDENVRAAITDATDAFVWETWDREGGEQDA